MMPETTAMSPEAERLLELALKLSREERGEFVDQLIVSLDGYRLSDEQEAEIARRIREIDEGKAEAIPWEEARRRIMEP